MTTRTLRNWRDATLRPPDRPAGRPGWTPAAWRAAARAVLRVIAELGQVGWRTIHRRLGDTWSRYVVQHVLRHIKARRRRKLARRRQRTAHHVEVLDANAVWSMDGTHVGRTEDRRAVEAQVIKDNGSRSVLAAQAGRAATAGDVIELLQRVKQREGALPLALLTDNGPPYPSDDVTTYLEREQVLHILNLPHTPQHNGACEQLNGELKMDAELGKGVLIPSVPSADDALQLARHRLNRRPRAVLGGQSANDRHATAHREYTAALRESVYENGRRAMEEAMNGTGTLRARRLAARRAALDTLELYGIIKQSRGSDE